MTNRLQRSFDAGLAGVAATLLALPLLIGIGAALSGDTGVATVCGVLSALIVLVLWLKVRRARRARAG